MDLTTNTDVVGLKADGSVTTDGRLYGNAAGGRFGFVNVQGVLSKAQEGSAAYIFDGRIDGRRTVNGATTWR
jgi:hypothetical protein